jgi:hypothetical protein
MEPIRNMTTAATIPHVLGEATLGELAHGLRGQLVRPDDDGYDEAGAVESAGNQLDASASCVSMTIVRGSS